MWYHWIQELFQSRNHKNFLSDVAISTTLNQAASCGDNRYVIINLVQVYYLCVPNLCSIKIHDMEELKEVYTIIDIEEEKGIFLHVCCCLGINVYMFLSIFDLVSHH